MNSENFTQLSRQYNLYNLFKFHLQEGKLRWKTNIDESSIYAAALVDQNIIVVTTLGGTIAFLKHDGCIKFKTCCKKPFFSSPCAVGSDLCVTIDVIGIIRVFNTISGAKVTLFVLKSLNFADPSNKNEHHLISDMAVSSRWQCFFEYIAF